MSAAPRMHRVYGLGNPAPIIEERPTPELIAERAELERAAWRADVLALAATIGTKRTTTR